MSDYRLYLKSVPNPGDIILVSGYEAKVIRLYHNDLDNYLVYEYVGNPGECTRPLTVCEDDDAEPDDIAYEIARERGSSTSYDDKD